MSTNETREENIKTIVKLGIDVKDIADVYLEVGRKRKVIYKKKYIFILYVKFFFDI